MTLRALHAVDRLPSSWSDDRDRALRWLLEGARGERLTAVPCASRPRWIVHHRSRTGEIVSTPVDPASPNMGDGAACDSTSAAASMRLEQIDLCGGDDPEELVALVRRLGEEYGRPDLRLQVSVPNPVDLAAYMIGRARGPERRVALGRARGVCRAYRLQLLSEIHWLEAAYHGDLEFEVEVPWMLGALGELPRGQRAIAARLVAFELARFIGQFPRSSRVVLHLCDGRVVGRGVTSSDLELVTRIARTVARRVRRRNVLRRVQQAMPAVHVSACVGRERLRRDPGLFAPLACIPEDVALYAGVVGEHDLAASRLALKAFERAAGRAVAAVSTTCGSWVSSAAETNAGLMLMCELASEPGT